MIEQEALVGACTFIAVVTLSLLLKESCYPFSKLGMFAYPYQEAQVIFLVEDCKGEIVPAPEVLGAPTSGLCREYASHLEMGGSIEGIVDVWEARMREVSRRPTSESYRLWIRTISVERGGHVDIEDRSLPTRPLSAARAGDERSRREAAATNNTGL